MNPNLERLHVIGSKKEKLIIGLMSGTSLDGLDIALCRIEGNGNDTRLQLLQFETLVYSAAFRKEIQQVFAKKNIDGEKLCLLHPWIALQHAAMILNRLKKWGMETGDIDLLASHGQTIYHAPSRFHENEQFGNATLQLGDGDHLSVATGIITVSDFRQKHIAAGGEGAPLAVYGDRILFSKKGEDRILLNIGGIANFTWLPGNSDTAIIFCTDTGPGNTLMDGYVQSAFPGQNFDLDARLAMTGTVNNSFLAALKDNDFFKEGVPRTTGPELFGQAYLNAALQRSHTTDLEAADVLSTLNIFSAETIAEAIRKCIKERLGVNIYGSGGGIHNPLLRQHLSELLPGCNWYTTADLGIDPNAKEAVLFAVLANECICGNPALAAKGMEGMPLVSMGKISFPS